MADNAQLEYCRVSVATGDILEGPIPLPKDLGSVRGFCNLPPKELRRYGWFPVDIANVPKPYGLMFLPELGKVVKTHQRGPMGGRKEFAIIALRQKAQLLFEEPFYSDVLGRILRFPNTSSDQLHRLNCLQVGADYSCSAWSTERRFELATVPCDQINGLIKDSVAVHNKNLASVAAAYKGIGEASDREIVALIDTRFVDYFDD